MRSIHHPTLDSAYGFTISKRLKQTATAGQMAFLISFISFNGIHTCTYLNSSDRPQALGMRGSRSPLRQLRLVGMMTVRIWAQLLECYLMAGYGDIVAVSRILTTQVIRGPRIIPLNQMKLITSSRVDIRDPYLK